MDDFKRKTATKERGNYMTPPERRDKSENQLQRTRLKRDLPKPPVLEDALVEDTLEGLLQHYGLADPPCFSDLPPGWDRLVDELICDLLACGWDGDLHQVKEKFGGLRFYIGEATPTMHALIQAAEDASFKICDQCGEPGRVRHGGWIRVRCDECAGVKP